MNTLKYFSNLRSSFFAFFVLGLFLQSAVVAAPPLQRRISSPGKKLNPPVASRGVEQRRPEQGLRRLVQRTLRIQDGRLVLGSPVSNGASTAIVASTHSAAASASAQDNAATEVETTEIVHTINTPESIDALLNLIRNLRHPNLLKKLQIEFDLDTQVEPERIIELLRRLSQAIQHLEILSLNLKEQDNFITDDALEAISSFLRSNPHLQDLDINLMYDTNITSQGVGHLARALSTLSSLKSLSLSFIDNLNDKSARILFEALLELQNLEELDWISCGPDLGSDNSIEALTNAIKNLQSLRKIDLDFSGTLYRGTQILFLIKNLKHKQIQFQLDLSESFALEENSDEIEKAIGSDFNWKPTDLPNQEHNPPPLHPRNLFGDFENAAQQPQSNSPAMPPLCFDGSMTQDHLNITITNLDLTVLDGWIERLSWLSQSDVNAITDLHIQLFVFPPDNPLQIQEWRQKIVRLLQKLLRFNQLTHFTFDFRDYEGLANEALLIALGEIIRSNHFLTHLSISINHAINSNLFLVESQRTERGIRDIIEHSATRSVLQSLSLSFIGNISPLGTSMLRERLPLFRDHPHLRELVIINGNPDMPLTQLVNIPHTNTNTDFSAALESAITTSFQGIAPENTGFTDDETETETESEEN